MIGHSDLSTYFVPAKVWYLKLNGFFFELYVEMLKDMEVTDVQDEKNEKKTMKAKEVPHELEQLNNNKHLWMCKSKGMINDEYAYV